MPNKLTDDYIKTVAATIKVDWTLLKAFLIVECKGSGFNADGITPKILFERHVFRQRLIKNGKKSLAYDLEKKRPDLCNRVAGGYGTYSAQNKRLDDAATYDRASALESASWGIGQVMGYHWEALGYKTLQDFINKMYMGEREQFDAVINYLLHNNLIDEMQRQDYAGLAKGYNGSNYAINRYDVKLEREHERMKG